MIIMMMIMVSNFDEDVAVVAVKYNFRNFNRVVMIFVVVIVAVVIVIVVNILVVVNFVFVVNLSTQLGHVWLVFLIKQLLVVIGCWL